MSIRLRTPLDSLPFDDNQKKELGQQELAVLGFIMQCWRTSHVFAGGAYCKSARSHWRCCLLHLPVWSRSLPCLPKEPEHYP